MTELNNNNAELNDEVSVSSKQSEKEEATNMLANEKPALESLPEGVKAALIALKEPQQAKLKSASDKNESVLNSNSEEEGVKQKENVEEYNSNEKTDPEVVKYEAYITTVTEFLDKKIPSWVEDLELANIDKLKVRKDYFGIYKLDWDGEGDTFEFFVEIITDFLGERNFDVQSILPQEETRTSITEYFSKVGSFFLQSGHFILNNREYAALGFISFIALPLFNFASMGLLAYVAYPLLVLATMQVLYFNSSSSVMRDGVKLNTKYVSNILDLSELTYEAPEVVESPDASKDDQLESSELVSDHDSQPEEQELILANSKDSEAEDTYWKAFTSFDLVKLFSNLHPSVMSDKWKDAGSEDKTWSGLLINSSKIALLYTGVYFGVGLVTPFVINPLHTVLALGGSASLVGSYFAAIGVGYLFSKATNQSIAPENTAWYQGSGIVTLVAVAALLALSIVFMPQAWLASVLATPAAVAFIAPSVIALGALGAYTTNAINAKMAANNAENEEEGPVHNALGTEDADNASVSSKSVDKLEVKNTTKPETSTTIVKKTQEMIKAINIANRKVDEIKSGLDNLGADGFEV